MPKQYGIQLHTFFNQWKIQNDGSLYFDGIWHRAIQRNEKIYRNNFLQNAKRYAKSAGGRSADSSGRISTDPAKSGIQFDRSRQVPNSNFRRHVRLGMCQSAI